jgi:hypothetical protein
VRFPFGMIFSLTVFATSTGSSPRFRWSSFTAAMTRLLPEHSREYAAQFPDLVQLVERDADHDLNGHLEQIWGLVESFLLDT